MDVFEQVVQLFFIAFLLGVVLWGAHWSLIGRHAGLEKNKLFPRQLILLAITILSVIAFILVLPVEMETRHQVLSLVGLVISGIFAFASTTVFANLMAGIMLRITQPFHTGDFVKVGDNFGRISAKGLLDTELQTENRELISLPNLFLIAHPITSIQKEGAIVSTTLSLGYDVHHAIAEEALIKAALKSGLKDPFVHVMELGNFSIVYKLSGVLEDAKSLLTASSNLNRYVLDTLHADKIEIMSPSIMNQRRIDDTALVIPSHQPSHTEKKEPEAEEIVFDKAEEAEQKEEELIKLKEELQHLEDVLKESSNEKKEETKKAIDEIKKRLEDLQKHSKEAHS